MFCTKNVFFNNSLQSFLDKTRILNHFLSAVCLHKPFNSSIIQTLWKTCKCVHIWVSFAYVNVTFYFNKIPVEIVNDSKKCIAIAIEDDACSLVVSAGPFQYTEIYSRCTRPHISAVGSTCVSRPRVSELLMGVGEARPELMIHYRSGRAP